MLEKGVKAPLTVHLTWKGIHHAVIQNQGHHRARNLSQKSLTQDSLHRKIRAARTGQAQASRFPAQIREEVGHLCSSKELGPHHLARLTPRHRILNSHPPLAQVMFARIQKKNLLTPLRHLDMIAAAIAGQALMQVSPTTTHHHHPRRILGTVQHLMCRALSTLQVETTAQIKGNIPRAKRQVKKKMLLLERPFRCVIHCLLARAHRTRERCPQLKGPPINLAPKIASSLDTQTNHSIREDNLKRLRRRSGNIFSNLKCDQSYLCDRLPLVS